MPRNIIIPIVGRGTRTKEKYNVPKPLIKLNDKTIIEHSVNSLGIDGNYIFIIRRFIEYGILESFTEELKSTLLRLKPDCKIIEINYLTEGPASSCLLAKEYINNEDELIITNCDQYLDWKPKDFFDTIKFFDCDGCVSTYPHPDIQLNQKSPYSFIKLDEEGFATQFEEKFAISENALNGLHYFRQGKNFVDAAEKMIENNDRVNNEFYVSKTYNELIKQNKKVAAHKMFKHEFYALGDSIEIQRFLDANL